MRIIKGKILLALIALCLLVLPAHRAWAADDIASWTDLQDAFAAGSNDLNLTQSITAPAGGKITATASFTIAGNGNTITAGDSLFSLSGGATFKDVTFAGGSGSEPAIAANGGTVSFENSTFNMSTTAVSIAGATAAFSGTTFNGTSAAGDQIVNVMAGTATFGSGVSFTNSGRNVAQVVNIIGGIVTFESGVSFTANQPTGSVVNIAGGAVTFKNGAAFTNNTSGAHAVNVTAGTGSATFEKDVAFTGNTGGAISAGGGTITLNGNTFTNNGSTTGTFGGAVHIASGATVNFAGTEIFTGNRAERGGAIYTAAAIPATTLAGMTFKTNQAAMGGALYTGAAQSVAGGTFEGNTATGSGGAIASAGSLTITGGTFTDNTAASRGGTFFAEGTATISGGIFSGSKTTTASANQDSAYGGGLVFANNVTLSSMTFANIESAGNGGVAYASRDITVSGAAFENNTSYAGGALHARGAISATDTVFSENKSTGAYGGATYSVGRTTSTNALFSANEAALGGGALFAGGATVKESSFLSNASSGTGGGGAILIYPTAENASSNTILRSVFNANATQSGASTSSSGGAIYFGINSSLEVNASVFNENYASSGRGGAIYAATNVTKLDVAFSTFYRNRAEGSGTTPFGGAVYTGADTSRLINSTFANNDGGAGGSGGGVYLTTASGSSNSVVFYCTFTGNLVSGGLGGGLYADGSVGKLEANVFVGNTAQYGTDLFRGNSAILNSGGYNVIGGYGFMNSGTPTDYEWSADATGVVGSKQNDKVTTGGSALLFGSNTLAANAEAEYNVTPLLVGSTLSNATGQAYVMTVALAKSANATALNPALGIAESSVVVNHYPTGQIAGEYLTHTDARGVKRQAGAVSQHPLGGRYVDAGAYQTVDPTGGEDPDPDKKTIASVALGGIPNIMMRVGQTCTLAAVVRYQDGTIGLSETVTWRSSDSNVAQIDKYGNMVSVGLGTTTITVTTDRVGVNGVRETDSDSLTVEYNTSYTNIHTSLWSAMSGYNGSFSAYGAQIYFDDLNPENITTTAFASAYQSAYGVTGTQMRTLDLGNNFAFTPEATSGSTTSKPAIGVTLSTLIDEGAILPMKFTFSLSWDDVSSLLGKEITTASRSDIIDLFGKVKLVYTDENGKRWTIVDQSSDGLNISNALGSDRLTYESGNNLSITLYALLTDAAEGGSSARAASSGARLINGRIVLPDNDANGDISLSVRMVNEKSGGGGDGDKGDGGGGGGCDAGFGFGLVALAGVMMLTGRRRNETK